MDAHRTIEAIVRIESPKLIARLVRLVRDVGLAEEAAQDAFVAALSSWPKTGIPDRPGAWLMGTAKHRAIDALRRSVRGREKLEALGLALELGRSAPDLDQAIDEEVGDDLLRLVLTACHPALPAEARVALTLRLLGGLSTAEIARSYLTSEATIAQRIVRAKRALAEAKPPYEVPRGADLSARLSSVLEVIYLIFNEGYSASAGQDWMRPELIEDALRLGRVLVGLVPREPEAHALVALMELQASRARARLDAKGEPILLLDQDRSRWDRVLIGRGLAALAQANALGGAEPGARDNPRALRGPYALQAAIAACHARAFAAAETDWKAIAALYLELAQVQPSPVVELNRAVAVGMAEGPAQGLALVDELVGSGALEGYPLLPSVRADLLLKLGRAEEAKVELGRAIQLTDNARTRALLERRLAGLP